MIDADQLSAFVREHAEEICQYFFPLGKRDGHEWKIGDVSGKAGNSLGIEIEGDKAGLCNDRAGGFKGNLISLIGENRGLKYPLVAEEIGRAFGVSFSLNGAFDFDWGKLERLNSVDQIRLAKWRAFRPEFVEELVAHDLVRLFKDRGLLCWAFPIHAGGRIGGCHFRAIDIDESKRPDWRVYPTQKNGGTGMQPLVIGNLERALRAHICESTWDALVLCDSLGIDLGGASEDVLFCTRGGANGKFVDRIPETIQAIYVWPQNDQAGQDWLRKVSETLRRPFYRVHVPAQHKDLNDWVRAGGSCEELCDAIETADLVEGQKAPPFAEKLAEDNSGTPDEHEAKPERLSGRNIVDFLDLPIDPKTNFLGNRFLTMGSGMFLIAPSGHGKSSFSIQLLISFAIGRAAFGIKPPRPLRILCIQSEDDDAETKKFAQVIRKMNLTGRELELLKGNTRFEYRNDLTGDDFLKALECFCSEWPPELIIANPLTGFLLADLKDDEKVARFLRTKLNPILSKHSCAAIIVHHTPKTNFKKLADMEWYDWMYAMAGCAALTNWARAVLVLAPSKIPGTYRLIAAKRFDEIQWTEREYWFSHSKETITHNDQGVEVISWVAANNEQISAAKPAPKTKKKPPDLEEVWQKMSPLEEYTREIFEVWCGKEFSLGANKSWSILKALDHAGLVQVSEEKRPRTNPLKRYRKVHRPASTNGSGTIE